MGQWLSHIPGWHSIGQLATLRTELHCRASQPRINAHFQGRGRRSCAKLEHRWALGLRNSPPGWDLDKPALTYSVMVDGKLVHWITHRSGSSAPSNRDLPGSKKETLAVSQKGLGRYCMQRGVVTLGPPYPSPAADPGLSKDADDNYSVRIFPHYLQRKGLPVRG